MGSLGPNRYGKGKVFLLRVVRDAPKHIVHELKVQILLEGDFDEAFLTGSNSQIVATESQKNLQYFFAKKHPIEPIENWAIAVVEDMMAWYPTITGINMEVEQTPWERIVVDGKEHNHAFQKVYSGIRFCDLRVTRKGTGFSLTRMISGFKELQVLKTTQSGFEGFVRDGFTTLKDTKDRVFATKVKSFWKYFDQDSVDLADFQARKIKFSEIFSKAQNLVLKGFAGPADSGVYSPSVQFTIYQIGQSILKTLIDLASFSMELPNIHYYLVDFSQFKTELKNNNEVFFTFDGAHGQIEATIVRSKDQIKSQSTSKSKL